MPQPIGRGVQLFRLEQRHPLRKLLRAQALAQFFDGATQPERENEGEPALGLGG